MRQWNICKFYRIIGIFLSALVFVGCQRYPHNLTEEPNPLPKKVFGADDSEEKKIQKRLTHHGVKIISIGQDYLVSVPSTSLFADQSPRILWGSYALLNEIVCYLKEFRIVGVDVSAHGSKYVSTSRERALTSARARAVADYLWTQNIDSRFVFTRGLGSDKPIQTNTAGGDASLNSRIEITFRNAVA